MSKFHFFTDIDLLQSQSINDAFGPITNGPDFNSFVNKYRVTSSHKTSSNCNAYAVCKGQILVQPDLLNSSLVNIVLKPDDQPGNDCPSVKFYIYRGIVRESLIDGNNVQANNNRLTYIINEDIPVNPDNKTLGFKMTSSPNFGDSDPIDNAFYIKQEGFTLFTVEGGDSIGTFHKDKIGFEIMLNRIGFNPSFSLVRKNLNYIESLALSASSTFSEIFDHWNRKEGILDYLDPAAYYGNFFDSSLYSRKSTSSISSELIPQFEKTTGKEIYKDILNGVNGNFFNKNFVYIDIRNELNYSFNYFRNYSNEVKLSFTNDNNTPNILTNYYKDSTNNEWPLLRLSDFPNGSENFVRVLLPKGDNTRPLAYVSTGDRIKGSLKERAKRLLKGQTKFVDLEIDDDSSNLYLTQDVGIKTPKYDTNTSVASYIRIKYLKRFDRNAPLSQSANTLLKAREFLDHMFQPLEMKIPFKGNESIKINIYQEDFYVDLQEELGVDYIAKLGIARDNNNTTLFAIATEKRERNRLDPKSIISLGPKAVNASYDFLAYLDQNFIDNSTLKATKLFIGGDTVQITRFEENNKLASILTRKNLDKDFIAVVIPNAKFDDITTKVSAAGFSSKYKIFLGIEGKRSDKDDVSTNDFDNNGTPYLTFDLQLRGFVESGGDIETLETKLTQAGDPQIKVYGYIFK
ncbi:MAG TPA: hypothetical protein VFF27_07535 [Bacteroidia bacterium]|nr:hypothetical protein [Bacteroidia bacterium]